MKFSINTTLGEIYNHPSLAKAKKYLVGKGESFFESNSSMTLEQLNKVAPSWGADDMVSGINRLLEEAENNKYMYHVYSEEEISDSQDKKDVVLFHFPVKNKMKKKNPFVIITPGGGYNIVASIVEGFPIAEEFNKLGYTAFCLNYRTAQDALFPKTMDDYAAAYNFIINNKEHFDIDSYEYFSVGFSAGGHLASMWGSKQHGYFKYGILKPQLLMLGYPFTSEEFVKLDTKNKMLTRICGEKYKSKDVELYRTINNIDVSYPAVYLVHAKDDDTVLYQGSKKLADILKSKGIKVECEFFAKGEHGFGLGTKTEFEGWIKRGIKLL